MERFNEILFGILNNFVVDFVLLVGCVVIVLITLFKSYPALSSISAYVIIGTSIIIIAYDIIRGNK